MSAKNLFVSLTLASAAVGSSATTYTAVFKPVSAVGSNATLGVAELGYRYEVVFNFGSPGRISGIDAPADTGGAQFFFANVKTNNFTMQTPPAGNDSINQFGVWSLHPNGSQTVWGSGSTYGGFTYKTRLSLTSGDSSDYTTIDGLWADLMPEANIENFQRSDKMLWMIYDTARLPNGTESQGSYFATLESVTATVPEPSPISLLLLAGVSAAGIRYLRHRRNAFSAA